MMILTPAPKPATTLVVSKSGANSLKVHENQNGLLYIQLRFNSNAAAVNFARAYMGNTHNVKGYSVYFAKTKGMAAFKKMGIQTMHGPGRHHCNTFTLVTQENPHIQHKPRRPIVFNPHLAVIPQPQNHANKHDKPKISIKFSF